MKFFKIKLVYCLLSIALSLFCSCKKALDIEPKNAITFKNGIKTEKDIESLFGAVNQTVRSVGAPGSYGASTFSYYFNKGSDNFHFLHDLNKLSAVSNISWASYYQIIHQANIPLQHLDQTNMSEERKNYYVGLANFYKAYAYWNLLIIWGDVILVKENVILDPVSKTPWPKVADYAIELAEEAVALLPEYRDIKDAQGSAPINKFSPSKGSANALLANLAAWKAGTKYMSQPNDANYDESALWRKAANACTAIIESGQYSLAASPEEVCISVLAGDSQESIYEIDYRRYWDEALSNGGTNNIPGLPSDMPLAPQLYPGLVDFPTYHIFESRYLLADSIKKLFPVNDLRRYSWFYKLDSLSSDELRPITKGYAYPNKFRTIRFITSGPGIGSPQGIFMNFILWRLAGIYLLRAECRAKLGNAGGAIEDLNLVRARAKAYPYQSSEGELKKVIFDEIVKKEMLYEPGYYWIAMVRNGYIRKELKNFGYDKLSDQDLIDGALFSSIGVEGFSNNPLLRQNVYWWKRFGN